MKILQGHSRAARLTIAAGMLLMALPLARAGELRLRSLTVKDGLSQSHVETITQDRDGYIWLGTASGLNRYDGYQVEVYKHDPDDASSLSDDGVYALHVDARGIVWVGTSGGLDRFAPGTDSFVRWMTGSSDPSGILAGGVAEINLAQVHAGLGEIDEAFEMLEIGVRKREPWILALRCGPGFDTIRDDPRFADLLRRIGVEP